MLILNKFTITITYLLVANNWIIFSVPAFFAGKELLIAPPPPSLLFKGVKYACPLPVFWNLTHLSNDYHQHVWYGFSRHPKWNVYSSKPPGTDTYFINSPPPRSGATTFTFSQVLLPIWHSLPPYQSLRGMQRTLNATLFPCITCQLVCP